MAKSFIFPAWQRSLIILSNTFLAVVVVGVLYWAQVVMVPLALATFLAFLLTPVADFLDRRGVGRVLSVILIVIVLAALVGSLAWVITREAANLAKELPIYTENVKEKVRSLRQLGHGAVMHQLGLMTQEISVEWRGEPGVEEETADPKKKSKNREPEAAPPEPPAAETRPEKPAWMSNLISLLGAVAESLGHFALAIVLVVFMLIRRETLRNRIIRLVGQGRISLTTRAIDDAGYRIRRSLLMQIIVNGTFGIAWSLGLLVVGVNYWLLWGLLAAILRYIPFIGAPLSALFPLALCLAQFPGWWQIAVLLGYLLVIELLSNNFMEPWLYGQSIGVSEVALILAAIFWTFLWGPIGLILSNPLTICLVVMGKHIPQLKFLEVLMCNEELLDCHEVLYQRLLARDQDEASQLVQAQIKASSREEVYDSMLIPVLNYTKKDLQHGDLTEDDEQYILQVMREIMADMDEGWETGERSIALPKEPPEGPSPTRTVLLACPAHDKADHLALAMLEQLLDSTRWKIEITALETLTSEILDKASTMEAALICIGALPPGGLSHSRYLCKRLRARFPTARIIVGRWGLKDNAEGNEKQLLEAGATHVATTLLETRTRLLAWQQAVMIPKTQET